VSNPRLTACIVSTGEEVLRGELIDSNSAELARQLGEAGFQIQLMLTAGDRRVISILSCARRWSAPTGYS